MVGRVLYHSTSLKNVGAGVEESVSKTERDGGRGGRGEEKGGRDCLRMRMHLIGKRGLSRELTLLSINHYLIREPSH